MNTFLHRSLTAFLLIGLANNALAGPTCTEEPKSKWQDTTAFQKQLEEQGYEIRRFKETSGNCYEIYGFNKDREKVEIYFNPVDGSAVKTNIKK